MRSDHAVRDDWSLDRNTGDDEGLAYTNVARITEVIGVDDGLDAHVIAMRDGIEGVAACDDVRDVSPCGRAGP
jgi:hypothetical protein